LYKQAHLHVEFIMKKPKRSGNLRLSIARAIIWGKIWDEVPGTSLRRQVPGDVQGLYARQKAASFTLDERASEARAINVG
jgi:hypothetical protein